MDEDTGFEQELVELEKQYWRALQDGNVDAATRMTDFPCILTGAQGVSKVDQKTFARMMADPPYTLDRVELSGDPQVRLLGDDVAVVAYRVRELLTVDGKPITLDAADSSTWVRRNGSWRCALHTEAITGDAFGRDRTSRRSSGKKASSAPEGDSEDEGAIREVIETWLRATRAGDHTAVLELMADDVVFLVPGREPFGKEAFAPDAPGLEDMRIEGQCEIEEIEVLGDRAWCRTHLTVTVTPRGGEPTRRSGHTLSIFRKMPDGRWVLARDANLLAEVESPAMDTKPAGSARSEKLGKRALSGKPS